MSDFDFQEDPAERPRYRPRKTHGLWSLWLLAALAAAGTAVFFGWSALSARLNPADPVFISLAWLRENANDGGSVELVRSFAPETLKGRDGKPFLAQRIKFRAKNGFGAMVLSEEVFVLRAGEVRGVVSADEWDHGGRDVWTGKAMDMQEEFESIAADWAKNKPKTTTKKR